MFTKMDDFLWFKVGIVAKVPAIKVHVVGEGIVLIFIPKPLAGIRLAKLIAASGSSTAKFYF